MTDASKEIAAEKLGFEEAVARTGVEMRRLLKGAPAVIRHMTAHLAKAAGKMIRARALLACAIQRDGLIDPDAVRAAAAVELLHLATLVHDDIIDDADKRRGIDALHKKFGEKYAVLCGDYLFCIALEFVSNASVLETKRDALDKTFPRYLTEVCLGELRQNQNNCNFKLTEREYFKIIKGKTAALFEASFYTGFLLSDEDAAYKDTYKEVGCNIGVIFQLADDCADYEAAQKVTKKPVLSDYSRGVITLPIIYTLKKDPALYETIAGGMTPEALKAVVQESGGLQYTHGKIDSLYKKTKIMLNSLDIGTEKKELLMRLLQKSAGVPA